MRKLLIIIFTQLLLVSCFGFGQEDQNKLIDEPFKKPIGKNSEEVLKNFGQPLVLNKFKNKYGGETQWLFYDGFHIAVSKINSDVYVSINIYTPKFELIKGIKVGLFVKDVIKAFGEPPSGYAKGILTYQSNYHSLSFKYDQYEQIYSIGWSYVLE